MTIAELREHDLKCIINNLHFDYVQKDYYVRCILESWAQQGEGIKKEVINCTRVLYTLAEENSRYLDILLNQYKNLGYVETEEIKEIMQEEKTYYETELRKLEPLKFLIPLVKPLVQLNNKGGK